MQVIISHMSEDKVYYVLQLLEGIEGLTAKIPVGKLRQKSSIGKLEIRNSMEEIAGICLKYKIELMAINPQHLDQIANLPQIHGESFDRLIISQAIVENLTIVTRDSMIPQDDVNTIWQR